MAIYSMTAFAQARTTFEQMQILLEIRSVNNRYLDLHLRMPDELRFFEPRLRALLSEHTSRGNLDARFQGPRQHTTAAAPLATDFLEAVSAQLQHIREVRPERPAPAFKEVFALASQHQAIEKEHWRPLLESLTAEVLQELTAHRAREGEQLGTAMRDFARQMLTHIETVKKDRKSTRLNSSHVAISYAVFCLKKKKKTRK